MRFLEAVLIEEDVGITTEYFPF